MAKPLIAMVVGTRPDAIKSAPVAIEILKYKNECSFLLISTGQHREMLEQALGAFGLKADIDLGIMRHGQTLGEVTAGAMMGLEKAFIEHKPDYVFAQGDTTTTFVASLAAFYQRIPFGHIEAGLRTPHIDNPFPEEFNRRATGLIARHHFAPTTWAKENLLREAKDESTIFVTGNTGIDSVRKMAQIASDEWYPEYPGRVCLLTTHRRENWGEPQRNIAEAAKELASRFPDTLWIVPMHRNPLVRETLIGTLGNNERFKLIEPPDYAPFVKLMKRSHLILTDSGGVQEEAPAFGIPVLVMRETTERPEGVEAGAAKLVGTDRKTIVEEGAKLLSDPEAYRAMSQTVSPYGDGKAAERIRYVTLGSLGIKTDMEKMWTF
jgi:UDP-N-acetylglucosamine 2-epimerase